MTNSGLGQSQPFILYGAGFIYWLEILYVVWQNVLWCSLCQGNSSQLTFQHNVSAVPNMLACSTDTLTSLALQKLLLLWLINVKFIQLHREVS